jgi:hypothetical protein
VTKKVVSVFVYYCTVRRFTSRVNREYSTAAMGCVYGPGSSGLLNWEGWLQTLSGLLARP